MFHQHISLSFAVFIQIFLCIYFKVCYLVIYSLKSFLVIYSFLVCWSLILSIVLLLYEQTLID